MSNPDDKNDPEWQALARAAFPRPALKGSDAFVARVMSRVQADPAQGARFWWRQPRWLWGGVAVAATIGLLWLPHRPDTAPSLAPGRLAAWMTADLEAEPEPDSLGTSIEQYFL